MDKLVCIYEQNRKIFAIGQVPESSAESGQADCVVFHCQRRCMTKKRQFLFRPMWPIPWQWDTELEARLWLVIEGVLFWGTLLKIDDLGTMSTPITMVRPKNRPTSLIRLPGVTTVKWLQIGAALTFLSHTPSLPLCTIFQCMSCSSGVSTDGNVSLDQWQTPAN